MFSPVKINWGGEGLVFIQSSGKTRPCEEGRGRGGETPVATADIQSLTSGLCAGGKPVLPRRVTGFGVHDHADSVYGGWLQLSNRERVAADELLSGKLDPRAAPAVGSVLTRERVYAAHLRRPRTER